MRRHPRVLGGVALLCLSLVSLVWVLEVMAQPPQGRPGTRPRPGQGEQNRDRERNTPAANPLSEARSSPTDAKFRQVHQEFLRSGMDVVNEYMTNADRSRDSAVRRSEHEKAKVVCQQLLRIEPNFTPAQQMLERIKALESQAESVTFDVEANQNWQDTGVRVFVGKPVRLTVEGQWNLRIDVPVGPDGLELPREVSRFKLGELVGVIFAGSLRDVEPFSVGQGKEFVAERSGALYLKMNGLDPANNSGKVRVRIEGTFEMKSGGR